MELKTHGSSMSYISSEEDSSLDFGCVMDDSLTDIQWLQKMDSSKFQ